MPGELIRAFIALELAEPVHQKAVDLLNKVRGDLPQGVVRWVKADGLHLTIKFLGDIPAHHIEDFAGGLRLIAAQFAPFHLRVRKVGAFPNPRKPRVVWVGMEAEKPLTQLHHEVEALANTLGYPPEARSFSPHLTLGRVRQEASADGLWALVNWLINPPVVDLGECLANTLRLYRSELKPGGSVYTPLVEVKLLQNEGNHPATP
jgi:RNA 2',3'-cyclic 3'-phosphodiesterase